MVSTMGGTDEANAVRLGKTMARACLDRLDRTLKVRSGDANREKRSRAAQDWWAAAVTVAHAVTGAQSALTKELATLAFIVGQQGPEALEAIANTPEPGIPAGATAPANTKDPAKPELTYVPPKAEKSEKAA